MATLKQDVRKVQRNGVITNLGGVVVADWRWIQGKTFVEPRENEEFKRVFDQLKVDGISEIVPVPIPGTDNVGVTTLRTPVQEATIAQLDISLKRQGYFLHETPQPVR